MKTKGTSTHRRTGKIAALNKELRDFVNQQLDDGATYATILQELQTRGVSVNAVNLSNWKQGGYQDYLRDQSWRERINAKADRYVDIAINDGAKLAAGGLYSAAIQICELIDELAAAKPGETDADKCARMTNSLSRISRSILMLQQYRDAVEAAKPAPPDPHALTDEEKEKRMRQILGI